jgi:cysteine synthase B
MLGAALGFPVHLALPADASPERVQIVRAYGARLTLTDPGSGMEGARQFVGELVAREPEGTFHADQYNNPANPLAQYTTTGPEIWQQTGGKITHFVAGLGTAGTMMGTGRYLKSQNRDIVLVSVQAEGPQHGISGLKHLATAEVPQVYDAGLVDGIAAVKTGDAEAMASRLAHQEGLFVGVSAGAAVAAALWVARALEEGLVVALLADGGSSTPARRSGRNCRRQRAISSPLLGHRTYRLRLLAIHDQHASAVNLTPLERQKPLIGLLQREGPDGGLDGDLSG